jgi:hypothetical protein
VMHPVNDAMGPKLIEGCVALSRLDHRFHESCQRWSDSIWVLGFLSVSRCSQGNRVEGHGVVAWRSGCSEVEIDSAREPNWRAGSSRRGYCWPIGNTSRFLGLAGRSDCIIRRSNAASSAPWPKARWRRSTIALAPVGNRRSPSRPRHGWYRWRAGRRRSWAIPRTVDDPASGPSRPRAWTSGEGIRALANLAQGTACKILDQEDVKPHKVRYYLERRDPDFAERMAEVLCVYRQVKLLKKATAVSKKKPRDVAIISYDEKPGIQAIATIAPDLPPKPGVHATFAREHEYKRHGTLSLLAGIDLVTGKVHALVKDAESARGVSPRAAHRSGLDTLASSGSCHRSKAAAFH